MPPTKASLQKHSHHLLTLAQGAKHERDYMLKHAPASLDPLLHSIAKDVVSGMLSLPKQHRTNSKIDGLIKFANAPAGQRKRMLRPSKNGQHGTGLLSFLGPLLGEVGSTLLGMFK